VDRGVELTLRVQPRASRTRVVGLHGDALKIALAAPPVDGKANDALLAFLSELFGLPRARISLISGDTSRTKRVRIDGVGAADIEAAIHRAA
jgi:uncharacterized protein (TIGR00251 family)